MIEKTKKASKEAKKAGHTVPTDSCRHNKNKKEVFDVTSKALTVMQSYTDNNKHTQTSYINLSNHGVGNAPEALTVMQRFDTPRLHRLVGATPAWGAPTRYEVNNG